MATDNKLTSTIVSWFLGLVTLIVIGFFGYVVDDVKDKIADQTTAIEDLTKATNAAILDRALSGKDLDQIRKDLDEHIAKGTP